MGDYVDSFGLVRYVGRGEGVDDLYDASAKPSEGVVNAIEIKIDGKGIGPNVGSTYDRGEAYIPMGSVVGRAILFVEDAGGDSNAVTLSLVNKNGTAFDPALTMLSSTSVADKTAYNANGTNGKQIPVAFFDSDPLKPIHAFVKMTETVGGLKGVLKIEYV